MYIRQSINKRKGADTQKIILTHIIWFVSKLHKERLCIDMKITIQERNGQRI